MDVLRVRGLAWWDYWLANFIVDFTFFLVNLVILRFIVGEINMVYMSLFGVSMILFCYVFSFYFKTLKSAITFFPVINFLFGTFIPIVNFIETTWLKDLLLWILIHLYPFYDLQKQLLPDPSNPFAHPDPKYGNFIIQILFFVGLLACMEFKIYRRIFKK